MSEQPYEIEMVRSCGWDYWESMYATLTGLPKHEVWEKWPDSLRLAGSWGGQDFVRAARALGFNCNVRWVKFDPETPWPCILRLQDTTLKSGWRSRLHHQGNVYHVDSGIIQPLEKFLFNCQHLRITSMLQVWMSTSNVLLASEQNGN